jgi:hypothetical protein
MSSPVQLRSAEQRDLATVAALKVAAFQYSPYQQAVWPVHLRQNPGTADQVEWTLTQMQRALHQPRIRLIVAVDTTSHQARLAGYAEWILPWPETVAQSDGGHGSEGPEAPPKGLDLSAMKTGSEEINKLLRGKNCIEAFRGRDRERMWSEYLLQVNNVESAIF